jgi:hypothetical protein
MSEPIDWWRVSGEYFGYPQCCIDAFCTFEQLKDPEERQFRAAKHSGFIPCLSCAEKVLSGEVKLSNLIQSRYCETQFPKEGGASRQTVREWYLSKIDAEECV